MIALLQSNPFCALPTHDENISDGKENERETNKKSHPAIHDEIYGLVFLLFLCRTESLIIQGALENVLIEVCHVFNIYYSDIGAS